MQEARGGSFRGPCWRPATLKGGLGACHTPQAPPGQVVAICRGAGRRADRAGQSGGWFRLRESGGDVPRRTGSPGSWGYTSREVCSKRLLPLCLESRVEPTGLCLGRDRRHYTHSSPAHVSHLREERPGEGGVGVPGRWWHLSGRR